MTTAKARTATATTTIATTAPATATTATTATTTVVSKGLCVPMLMCQRSCMSKRFSCRSGLACLLAYLFVVVG